MVRIRGSYHLNFNKLITQEYKPIDALACLKGQPGPGVIDTQFLEELVLMAVRFITAGRRAELAGGSLGRKAFIALQAMDAFLFLFGFLVLPTAFYCFRCSQFDPFTPH